MREVTLSPVVERVLFVAALPVGLFMIALLFLVAGLLTPPSVARKGPTRFAEDRLLRLGVPFAVYVLLVQPTLEYALAHPLRVAPGSYWQEYLGEEGALDTGPLWFVGVLLVFSLAIAAWNGVRRHEPHRAPAGGMSPHGTWCWPPPSSTDLNFWQWPACLAVFAIGIAGSGRGWLVAVPDRLCRQCGAVTLVAGVAMAALLVLTGFRDEVDALRGLGLASSGVRHDRERAERPRR